jgi:hypothetical protein
LRFADMHNLSSLLRAARASCYSATSPCEAPRSPARAWAPSRTPPCLLALLHVLAATTSPSAEWRQYFARYCDGTIQNIICYIYNLQSHCCFLYNQNLPSLLPITQLNVA